METGKPEYIKLIEKKGGIFSIINLINVEIKPDFLDKKTFDVSYSNSIYDDKIIFLEKIYKTKQNFYIYLNYNNLDEKWINHIYYKQEQINELTFFINQLLKDLKNIKQI